VIFACAKRYVDGVLDKEVQQRAALGAASPEGLRDLILGFSRAVVEVWSGAAASVRLVNNDLTALSQLVSRESMTGVELRRALGFSSSSITELADRLERSGMITRSRQTRDRRVVVLKPTAKGKRTVVRALGPVDAMLSELILDRGVKDCERAAYFLLEITDRASRHARKPAAGIPKANRQET
jgi:DNA-binding MarR family transcriptional regulator